MSGFKKIVQKFREVTGAISPGFNTRLNFLIKKKRLPNLKKPITFDDKITWLKLYDYPINNLVIQCTDKYLVRDYIIEKGYESLLNELLGVWDSPLDINFEQLPQSFVLKWNNDYNSTYVIKDKENEDLKKIVSELDYKGKQKFYLRASEMHYKPIPKKVLAEKLLIEPNTSVLTDYKLYCYHGKVKYIMLCIGRDEGVKYYYFDTDWNFLRINDDGKNAPDNFTIDRPSKIDEMIEIAEVLSEPFKFVRSDFYLIEDRIIFGELTFTPASGMDPKLYKELDVMFGKDLILED